MSLTVPSRAGRCPPRLWLFLGLTLRCLGRKDKASDLLKLEILCYLQNLQILKFLGEFLWRAERTLQTRALQYPMHFQKQITLEPGDLLIFTLCRFHKQPGKFNVNFLLASLFEIWYHGSVGIFHVVCEHFLRKFD